MNGKFSFWKRWLLHSAIVWFILNLTAVITHLYYTNLLGITIRDYSLGDRIVNLNIHQATPVLILILFLLIELNHLVFYNNKFWIFVAGSMVTGLAAVSMLWCFHRIQHRFPPALLFEPFWLISGYAFLYPVVLQFINKKIFKAEQLYERSHAELHALKEQIHPHFLFNTLNSIYGTALTEQAPATASSIEKLAGLMRYILNDCSADFVPVPQEINFVEEYINLQKIRLPDIIRSRVITSIHCDETACIIAPLLLLPFIENAFKYGLSINHDCYMDLQLTVSNCHLTMHIRNSIVNNEEGTGTGINNAKKRLQLLYPVKHSIEISQDENNYTVQLEIQLS